MTLDEKNLLSIYLSYAIPPVLANSFLALYLLNTWKIGLLGLIAFYGIAYTVGALAVSRQKAITITASMTITAFILVAQFLTLGFPQPTIPFQWVLASGLYGLTMMYFWATYNTLHFQNQANEKPLEAAKRKPGRLTAGSSHAIHSAYYYTVIWLVGVIVPLIGVAILNAVGFSGLYAIAAIATMPFLYVALRQPAARLKFDLQTSWPKAKGYRTLTLLEGAISALPLALLPAVSVAFFPTPNGFGIYTALIALASVAAAILLAKWSDRKLERKRFLMPLTLLGAASLAAAALSKDAYSWTLATAAFSFLYALASPLRIAVILDRKNTPVAAMSNREFLLNCGRVLTLIATAASLQFGPAQQLIWPGIAASIAYAVVLFNKEGVH